MPLIYSTKARLITAFLILLGQICTLFATPVSASPPDAPQGLEAAAVGAREVYLRWDKVAFAKGYNMYRDGVPIGISFAPLYADNQVAPQSEYVYHVTAYNDVDEESAQSTADSTRTGTIIEAASCNQLDIQAAIDRASDGDTVRLPAQNATWTNTTDATPAITITNKAITLEGAGTGATVITSALGAGWKNWGIWVNQTENKPFRVTGITFTGETLTDSAFFVIQGVSTWWRFDHCELQDFTGSTFFLVRRTSSYGVIDHCSFHHSLGDQPIQMYCENDPPWERPLSLGTADAVYIEDCSFDAQGEQEPVTDSARGSRMVLRYSIMNGGSLYHNHGRDSGGGARGSLSYEVYHNKAVNWRNRRYVANGSRSGTGVIFDNIFEGNYGGVMYLHNYCSCAGYSGSCPDWPRCTSYPCTDQIGRGPDADKDGVQDLEPLYGWDNQADILGYEEPYLRVPFNMCQDMHDHVQENRDFYNNTPRPGYIPYTYPHPLTHPAVPEGPINLQANALSSDQVKLTWDSQSTTEEGFTLERSSDGTQFITVSTIRHDETTYTDNGLEPYQPYFYRVRAFNNRGHSEYSNITWETTHEVSYLGPVAVFDFEGDANDTSNGYEGAVYGASLVTGKSGQAYLFYGRDDYIEISPTIGPIQGKAKSFSLSAWVNTKSVDGNHWILGEATGYGTFLFGLYNGRLTVSWRDKSATRHYFFSEQYIDGEDFCHVAATYDSESKFVSLYYNGQRVLLNTDKQPGGINDITDLQIGRGYFSGTAEYFDGTIDEIQIYNYALSDAEIGSIYEHGAIVIDSQPPTIPQNLIAMGNGQDTVDLSWEPSTDNEGVILYHIYRNGQPFPIAHTGDTSYSDSDTAPAETYSYTVTAFDAAGNHSGHSDEAHITTPGTARPDAPRHLYLAP